MSFHPDQPPPKYEETASTTPGYPVSSYPPPGSHPPPPPTYPAAPAPGQYLPAAGQYQPPPPPGYMPAHNTVVITQPHMGALPGSTTRYGQNPALIVCQHCQATVTTSMEYKTGLLTWLLAGGICIVGCWLGCCFIPFCLDAAKDIEHECPNCKKTVGMFRHIR